MLHYPVFLSVVFVVKNHSLDIDKILTQACEKLSGIVSDFEIIVVDNASDDDGITRLKDLTAENGLPNLQVYALTQEVDFDTASWVGVENALGDFVAVMDPYLDDINFLTDMLSSATIGADVVFARNLIKPKQNFGYRLGSRVFNAIYKHLNGINLSNEAPQFRILNKKIINFILQHKQPALAYRHLPATGGFNRTNLEYTFESKRRHTKNLMESIDQGLRLLTSTTRAPMRLVTSLSLFGAFANLLYSVYVVAIGLFKTNVAAGWISLSLQQSGMFFLISLVLLVLGEYILQMASLTNEGPEYHVAQEFNSAQMTRLKKLNIEETIYRQEIAQKASEGQTS